MTHDTVAECLKSDGVTFHRLRTAPQFDFTEPRPLDEQVSTLQGKILGSASFAADFVAVREVVVPDVIVVDCMLVSTMAAMVDRRVRFSVFHHVAWMPGPGVPHDDWMNNH